MDKKKIFIIISLFLLFLVVIFTSLLLFLNKGESTDKKEVDENEVVINDGLSIEKEELFEYNKESLLETASKEVKELGELAAQLDSEVSNEPNSETENNNNKNNNDKSSVDYSNFFGSEDTKEIAAVKESKTGSGGYDDVEYINKVYENHRSKMEKPTSTNLSKDLSSKVVKDELGIVYTGLGDYHVQANVGEDFLYMLTYNNKVPVSKEMKDEGNITVTMNKTSDYFYDLDKYKDNFMSVFKYSGLSDSEIDAIFTEFNVLYNEEVKYKKSNPNYFTTDFKYLLNNKVLMSYGSDIIMFVIY